MYRPLLFLFGMLMLSMLQMSAQNIHVKSFSMDIKDQTANERATQMIDDNGKPCALIRIQTTEKGFVFEGGTVGIAKMEENHVGEIWVYVPAELRRITIRHAQLGTLKDYPFPETLQPARTYYMELITGKVMMTVDQEIRSQYLVIAVNPQNAMVEIDNEMVATEDGVATKYLPFGKYTYRISSKDYHAEAGTIEINDPHNKHQVSITLKPAFGWVEVLGDDVMKGASVYVDGENVGEIPLNKIQLKSGNHDIRVAKEKYSAWRGQVQVTDGETVQVSPKISANFTQVTLEVENDAEIWWNNTMIGRGRCTKDFDFGEQKFESRKANHRSQSIVIPITAASSGKYTIPAPIPINGSLNIEVKPVDSKVFLDNELVGTTPLFLQKVLIGTHSLRISHSGMRTDSREITIEEGKTTNVKATLSKELNVLNSRPAISDGHCTVSDEYDVIAANLFEGCKTLRTITIPPTISAIGASAFSGCYQLSAITIPQSVKSIEEKTFYWCAALKEVTMPEGITSIGDNAFTNCYSLQSVTLPSTLTSIADNAFTDCKSLKTIYVPAGMISTFRQMLPKSLHSKLKEK